jgi:CBS domain-containing protein
MLASVVFAFESTRQPLGLLPLLGGCAAAHLVSCLLMKTTIMTEKIVRRGVRVPAEYAADFLDTVFVRTHATAKVVALDGRDSLGAARAWLASRKAGTSHQGFPVLDDAGMLVGVITRRDLDGSEADPDTPLRELLQRDPVTIFDDSSLREAADQMVLAGVGRLPVTTRSAPRSVIGILTRSDLLKAHARRLDQSGKVERGIAVRSILRTVPLGARFLRSRRRANKTNDPDRSMSQ